jgi:hypothetical protein
MKNPNANRFLAIIVGIITVLALVVVFTANKDPQQLDRATPEGVVQQYLSDVIKGDTDSAFTFLDSSSACEVTDLDRSYVPKEVRMNLVNSTETPTGAIVRISIEIPSGDPLGGYFSEEQVIRLSKSNGNWLITGIPWPMYECGGEYK